MDGNGRWAERRGLPRTEGHTEGEENLGTGSCARRAAGRGLADRVRVLHRELGSPAAEVRHILGLHKKLFGRVRELNELNVRIQWMGRPFDSARGARTPKYVQQAIRKAIADTSPVEHRDGAHRGVRLRQPRRADGHAAEAARASGEPISEAIDRQHLYVPELPPVDVLVRTSGEQRISNFMLWQIAGARSTSPTRTWPEFDAERARRGARAA
jgi:undecaprenyl diphosphate synthase